MLLLPGLWLLSRFLFPVNTPEKLAIAALISWFVWLTAARLLWCILGRICGFYDPSHFHLFTRLWLPWRWPFLKLWLPLAYWREERKHGRMATARLAGPIETAANLYRPGYIPLGKSRPFGIGWLGFQPVGLSGESGAHLAMFGKTGGYKTTQLLTILGLHRGNAFIIDPKGQIAKVIANRFRAAGKKVCILDPTGQVKNQPRHRWSPFVELRRVKERAVASGRDAQDAVIALAFTMVEGLVVRYPKENPFWPGAAKDFMHGVILFITTLPEEKQTLAYMFELLTIGMPEKVKDPEKENGFTALLYEMSKCTAYGGVVAQSIAGVRGAGKETTGNLMITIREQLKWLKRTSLRECAETSDFNLEELKTGNLVLFVCAKLEDVRENFPGWFRLLTVMALSTFEDVPSSQPEKTLFVLDEFPSLGKIDRLEVAANYARSAGIRLLCILQDLGQIAGGNGAPPLYDNWETFIGNTECCWWLKTDHQQTLQYLERKLGKGTVKTLLDGPPRWKFWDKRLRRYDYKEREVMTANQIEQYLARGNMLITRGLRAFKLKPDPYFKALPVWRYDADPDFIEAMPRAVLRKLLARFNARPVTETEMDVDTALQVFGLSYPFTVPDIEARFSMLTEGAAFKQSEEYAAAVRQARIVLRREWGDEEGAAAA